MIAERLRNSPQQPVKEIELSSQFPKKDKVTIFEPKAVEPKFDPRLYSTPKGEKTFYNLGDIARDLGVEKSDVKIGLARIGIKDLKSKSRQGGKKDKMRLSYPQYQIIKGSLQQEVARKKRPKRESTSSPGSEFPKDKGLF